MSSGTSSGIILPKEKLQSRKYPSFTSVSSYFTGSTPIVNSTNLSTALSKYINPYPEFTFEKISEMDFGNSSCIARSTGYPINRPDFVNDYYFISMMRCLDRVLQSEYKGMIKLSYDTPSPSS